MPPEPTGKEPAVEVEALTVRYGSTTAVDGLSFTARAGSITAVLGPNGAGKTTTVETLEGYRRPTSGAVRVLGLDPIADHAALTPHIGVMLQEGGVYTAIRPPEVLRLFSSYYDDPIEPSGLLERVGLAEQSGRTWRQLSGGEKQRLSLALAIIGRPKVAFLDEPTAGIDPAGRRVIREVITDLRASGVCVLLTTHDLEEAEKLADRVLIVDHGRLLAEGTPAELMHAGATDELRFGAPPGLDVAALSVELSVRVDEHAPGEYLVHAEGTPALVAKLTAWLAARDVPLGDLRAGRQSLEDVFLRLTAEASNGSADHSDENDLEEPDS